MRRGGGVIVGLKISGFGRAFGSVNRRLAGLVERSARTRSRQVGDDGRGATDGIQQRLGAWRDDARLPLNQAGPATSRRPSS